MSGDKYSYAPIRPFGLPRLAPWAIIYRPSGLHGLRRGLLSVALRAHYPPVRKLDHAVSTGRVGPRANHLHDGAARSWRAQRGSGQDHHGVPVPGFSPEPPNPRGKLWLNALVRRPETPRLRLPQAQRRRTASRARPAAIKSVAPGSGTPEVSTIPNIGPG